METTPPEVHVMIDFETLGLRPDSVVLSLGASVFIPSILAHEEGYDFYEEADSTNQYNRYVDLETVKWWDMQARGLQPDSTQPLRQLVNKFETFLTYTLPHKFPNHGLILWSNGTDFDIPILYDLYKSHGKVPNWKYNNVRDYRTLRKMFPDIPASEFVGRKHNAGDDAWNEANHCKLLVEHIQNWGASYAKT